MNPGERAHRRFPMSSTVRETLTTVLTESELTRVTDYIAVLYAVIDALTAESTRAPEATTTLTVAEKTLALQSLILLKVGASKEEIAMAIEVYRELP